MRTDRFFYTPLNCSLYDKDIGYVSEKKSCCQFHKSSYKSSSGFTLAQIQLLVHLNSFFFFVCKIGHLDFLLLFPLSPHREPRVALPCCEEHQPQCPNVHAGAEIIEVSSTHGGWGTFPGLILPTHRANKPRLENSIILCLGVLNQMGRHFLIWQVFMSFHNTLHSALDKSRFFSPKSFLLKNLDIRDHGNERPWFASHYPFWGKAKTSNCVSFLLCNSPAAGLQDTLMWTPLWMELFIFESATTSEPSRQARHLFF